MNQPDLFPIIRPPPDPSHAFVKQKRTGMAAPAGTGPAGEFCRTCRFKVAVESQSGKRFLKCKLMEPHWTCGPGSDIKAKYPACRLWQAKPTEEV